MHRELLSQPHIASYPVLLLLGFLAGYLLARLRSPSRGIAGRHIDNIVLLLLVIGPAGARLFARLFYHSSPLSPLQVLKVWEGGGLVFYGGAIAGIITVILYAKFWRLSVWPLADLLAPSLAVGLAFGRIGCFLAGCCWGDLCVEPGRLQAISNPALRAQLQTFPSLSPAGFPLAVQFPADTGALEQHRKLGLIEPTATRSLPVHPAQLYEAAAAFLLCALLWRASRRRPPAGSITAAFLAGYGMIRFLLEFIRADSSPNYAGLTISQVISVGMILAGLLLARWSRRPLPKRVGTPQPLASEMTAPGRS